MTQTVIISDVHVPYQDNSAVNVMLKIVRSLKPETVIINGDLMDNPGLSKFTRDPLEPEAFKNGLDDATDIITDLQRRSKVEMVQGNHCSRLTKYINERAPDIFGILSMQELINDRLTVPIEYHVDTPTESMMYLGDDLLIGHWNSARKHTCYTAKGLVERFGKNIVQGHTHRLGEYAITLDNKVLRGWECGALCDVDPCYVLRPNWQQGFLVHKTHTTGWGMEIVPIKNGTAYFRGDEYVA